jgi:hypothetical protein
MNTRKLIPLTLIPTLVLFGYLFNNYAKNPLTPGFGLYPTLNDTEKELVVIINKSLEKALVDGEIIDGPYPDIKQPVILSNRLIDPYWVLPVKNWNIQVYSMNQIRNEYNGVDINGQKQRIWLQFNRIEFNTDNLAYVEMGLMYDYGDNPWGVAYWGLEVYFSRDNQHEWIVDRTNVLTI